MELLSYCIAITAIDMHVIARAAYEPRLSVVVTAASFGIETCSTKIPYNSKLIPCID